MDSAKGWFSVELPSLKEFIQATLDEQKVVGAAIGVVHDQTVIWSEGFGSADLDKYGSPNAETLFRIDSNTKPFTGVGIMRLRDEGLLDLNQPLAAFVPETELLEIRYGSIKDLTLRRLLTHRSGIVGEAPGSWAETGVGPTTAEILSRLDEAGVVIPPDSQHKYSNLAFMLLGNVIERLSGISYSDYVSQNIFQPLGMTGSTFDPDNSNLPRAVQYFGATGDQDPTPVRLVHNGRRPAGGIFSNVDDMAKWIAFQFQTEDGDATQSDVLASGSIEEMHQIQYMESDWQSGQCLPWRALRHGDHVFLGHGGGNPGSLSQTYFHKPTKIGVVVLTNSDAHTAHQLIAVEVMDRLVRAREQHAALLLDDQVNQVPPPPELNFILGEYVGNRPTALGYANSGIHITWLDGSLVALTLGEEIPVRIMANSGVTYPAHLDPTADPLAFIIREGRLAGEKLTFIPGDGTAVPSIVLQTGAVFRKLPSPD